MEIDRFPIAKACEVVGGGQVIVDRGAELQY